MRIQWDENKRKYVLEKRGIDFAKINELLYLPYIEDQRNEEPEQYRIIGFAEGRLMTYIIEYRHDEVGEYIWVVTAWHSTTQEQRDYEQETRI
ncbi:MAG: BrnT family toxin [SAR324 cluster bacterium]|nr:BrnT family toxin [SAR324 cluster bacterium]